MKKELLKAVILELAKLFTPIAWIAHFCHMNEVHYTGSLDFIFYGIGLNLKDRIKVERWLLAKLWQHLELVHTCAHFRKL